MQFSKMFLLTLIMTCVMTLLHVAEPSPVPASASASASASQTSVKTSDLGIEELANSLPMTNSRAARTGSVWSSRGEPAMRRGKLLNLHRA